MPMTAGLPMALLSGETVTTLTPMKASSGEPMFEKSVQAGIKSSVDADPSGRSTVW